MTARRSQTYRVFRPEEHARPIAMLLLVTLAAAAVLMAVAVVFLPAPVLVDGQVRWIRSGQSVAELVRKGGLAAPSGDLLAVKSRSVVEVGGGALPRLKQGSRLMVGTERIYPARSYRSVRGVDLVESVITTLEAVPPPTTHEGTGPLTVLLQAGTPGVVQVTKGAGSGEVVASMTVEPATPTVMRHEGFPRGAKLVALTFDDGPWGRQTRSVLDILRANEVRATFFMLGVRVRAEPDLARRVVLSGHGVGNHSMRHLYLGNGVSKRTIVNEIDRAQDLIRRTTGVSPIWYRPAGGIHSKTVDRVAKRLGLRLIRWTVDSSDYRRPQHTRLARSVVGSVSKHRKAVVLLHDGGGDRTQTIKALPRIIRALKRKGYRFVTLDELSQAP